MSRLPYFPTTFFLILRICFGKVVSSDQIKIPYKFELQRMNGWLQRINRQNIEIRGAGGSSKKRSFRQILFKSRSQFFKKQRDIIFCFRTTPQFSARINVQPRFQFTLKSVPNTNILIIYTDIYIQMACPRWNQTLSIVKVADKLFSIAIGEIESSIANVLQNLLQI